MQLVLKMTLCTTHTIVQSSYREIIMLKNDDLNKEKLNGYDRRENKIQRDFSQVNVFSDTGREI